MSGRLGKVLITAGSVAGSAAAIARLEAASCEVIRATTPTPIEERWLIEQTRDVAGLIFAMEPVSARLVEAARKLRVIARPGVGYDTVDIAACTRQGIVVTIAAGTNHESIADFTFALLLAAARGIVPAANAVQRREWQRFTGTEVWKKTLTIVGLGRIGSAVARRARGFDMRVLAVTRAPDEAFVARHGIELVTLERGLAEADFLSLHAPLDATTRHLLDASSLALMKRGAYVINTSRGGLVDEAALAQAVRAGRLSGAAVDVLEVQGAGSPSALIGEPRIVVTPHMATFSREAMERVALSCADSVIAVLRGERPPHVVNPEALHADASRVL